MHKKLVKFSVTWLSSYAMAQTNRQTEKHKKTDKHTHQNILHPSLQWINQKMFKKLLRKNTAFGRNKRTNLYMTCNIQTNP